MFERIIEKLNAGTEVPTSTNADCTTSSQTIAKPTVSGSVRYIVLNESDSGHCCFGYTIIDTEAGKEDFGDNWKRSMCETFKEEEAKIICDALNKHCR